ncbi:glycosyltransferase [Thermogemmata fonticola]|uniref:Glycosyltransferase n=1 Tax=Thermogemmata fonticola TaxID=2755323 RepID=A0A7V8VDK0_9BACT|nr:glycosyltransferase [Thermogemmata fonticola]MBA2226052.1 glycosyltransferase [Thermogemmata fonticola]
MVPEDGLLRVLHLNAGNLFGGIETYLLTLARQRHLCPAMELHFGLCFAGRLEQELRAVGVGVLDLGPVRLSRPWTVLRTRQRLRRFLAEGTIDVVVTHGSWPHVVFAPVVRRVGLPLVHCLHGWLDSRHWLNCFAARTPPDHLLANSRFTADSAAQLWPQVPVTVIYPPLPLSEEAAISEEARRRLRASFGTDPDAIVILMAARIEPLKGHAVLLEALGRLRAQPGWECWIAGGAQRREEVQWLAELRADAQRRGIAERVRFLGQRADVPALLAAANLYCQPNVQPEGFGLALVEALRAGLPVITSRFGGAVEIVTDDCGILCPPGDSAAVAEALCALMADPSLRQRLSQAGPARARALCNPTEQLARLYQTLAAVRHSVRTSRR